MVQICGDFKEVLPPTYEYLRLSFSPHPGVSLEERWPNNELSAQFLGHYFATFLLDSNKNRVRDATTYVVNELLENAIKHNQDIINYPIDLSVHLYTDLVVFVITNTTSVDSVKRLYVFIDDLIRLGPEKLFEINVNTDDGGSGLGFVIMAKDYKVKLGWRLEPIQQDLEVIKVTTMAQLPLPIS